MMKNKVKLNLSAFILGLTSMIGQIIIIRELIVVFYGNELSLGIILASWLFWVGFGGFLGRFVDKLNQIRLRKSPSATSEVGQGILSNIQLLISILLPVNIFLIRIIKTVLKIPAGKFIGFIPMMSSSFLSLSIICTLLGFTFTLLSKLASESNTEPSTAVGRIYLLEGLGASIGGILYSFFLIKNFTPFQNVLIVSGLNLIISILFNKNIFRLIYLLILSSIFFLNWPIYHLEKFARALQFRPFKLVESTDSIYGNITVVKIDKEFSFYENGLLIFTSSDLLTSEESVHYAMLEHPLPKKVLIIGGGTGESLKQVLKHNVDTIDYVELDPLIIKLSEKYLSLPKNPKINIIHMDGRYFVKKMRDKKYDVIILNLPDPYTAMLNRFYSLEFFREVKNILAPDGIFSFALTSSENYISPEHAVYLSCIYNTLKKEFRDIKTLPGDNVTFIASNKTDLLTYDANTLIKRLKERRINTKFVREYYLPFKLNPLRTKYIEETIKNFKPTKTNQDFRPIGYFYHTLVWLSLLGTGINILPYLGFFNVYLAILIAIILSIPIFLMQKTKKLPSKTPVILSIGTTGMSEICFQIIVILSFQFIYGYIYYKIGIILTSFMIGLVIGTFCINRMLARIRNEMALYIKTQISICAYPLILAIILMLISRINQYRPDIGNSLQAGFAMLPIIAGFIGGFQFPLANKICLKGSEDTGKTTGLLYGIDLFGSCIGGILVGIIFVPLLGIIQTCIVLSIVNILVLILLLTKRVF